MFPKNSTNPVRNKDFEKFKATKRSIILILSVCNIIIICLNTEYTYKTSIKEDYLKF